jgi:hypothetical protein
MLTRPKKGSRNACGGYASNIIFPKYTTKREFFIFEKVSTFMPD